MIKVTAFLRVWTSCTLAERSRFSDWCICILIRCNQRAGGRRVWTVTVIATSALQHGNSPWTISFFEISRLGFRFECVIESLLQKGTRFIANHGRLSQASDHLL